MSGVHREVLVQLRNFGMAAAVGACMTACYDVLRIFRRIIRHGILWVSVEDGLYWIGFAVAEFVLLYRESNGVPRAYLFLGTVAGAVLYHFLVSRPLMRAASKMIFKTKKFLQKKVKSVKIEKAYRTHD